MRLVRPALVWKLLVGVAVAASVTVLVSGALAAPRQHDAAVTFELVAAPRTCAAGTKRLGRACVNRSEIPTWTTIADGSAKNDVPGQWLTSYSWTLPQTVPAAGAVLTLKAEGQEKSGQANARICPAISAKSGFTFKGETQPAGVGFCAEAVTKPKADGTKKLTLLPPNVTPGSTVTLTIYVQYALEYTYTYRVVAANKATPKCRKPQVLDAGAVKCGEVAFAFSQGGLPKAEQGLYLDMTTNGIGHADLDDIGQKASVPENAVARVVRTVDYISGGRPTNPIAEEATLVFRAVAAKESRYFLERDEDGPMGRILYIALRLVSSNDPECPMPRRGRKATLGLRDGLGRQRDFVQLRVDGCPAHGKRFVDRSHEKPPHKPLVRVVITEKR